MGESKDLLEVKDLRTYFHSREGVLRAVDGVSFSLKRGRVLGIVGESGCGKSVTSQSILRIVPKNGKIESGSITIHLDGGPVDLAGLDPRGPEIRRIRGKEISMVFQEPMTSFSPVYTVGNQIMEVLRLHRKLSKEGAAAEAVEMLRKVGMPNPETLLHSYPFELSGGMRQRAMIAMALACRPRLLIADEPTSALDVTVQAQILELLQKLMGEFDMAVMLITHDLGVVAEMSHDILIMYLGQSVEYGSVKDVFHDPKHPYTVGLLNSIPKLGRAAGSDLTPIQGNVPNLYEIPPGCPFNPRCPRFMKGVCDAGDPPLVTVAPGHEVKCFLYGRSVK
jgi:peptide/nickel transport system ATP-binding protein